MNDLIPIQHQPADTIYCMSANRCEIYIYIFIGVYVAMSLGYFDHLCNDSHLALLFLIWTWDRVNSDIQKTQRKYTLNSTNTIPKRKTWFSYFCGKTQCFSCDLFCVCAFLLLFRSDWLNVCTCMWHTHAFNIHRWHKVVSYHDYRSKEGGTWLD